jgi:hypothetical protein
MNEKKALQGDYTLIVPKNKSETENFVIELKDIDEALYIAIMKLLHADKEMEAVKLLVRSLRVAGDNADEFCKDWRAVQAANPLLVDMLAPLSGELKKN